MQHVLFLGQDYAYQDRIASLLRGEGFTLSLARTVSQTVDLYYSKRIDMLVADLESWGKEGIALYRQVKQELGEKEFSCIIIISPDLMQEIKFSLSFDDFVVKNDDPAEVLLRIRQLLWRRSALDTENIINIEDLTIDLNNYDVVNRGKKIYLTYKEYELLKCLVLNRGKVFTREVLLDKVWGYDNYAGTRTVDIHIQRLRTKLGGTISDYIRTVRNVGYSFNTEKIAS